MSELRWIEDENIPKDKPDFDQFELIDQRSFKEHVLDKCSENIIVPMGLIATTACLSMGLLNMRRGNSHKQQLFMRGRVGFQAVTLVAMAIGMYVADKNRSRKHRNQAAK